MARVIYFMRGQKFTQQIRARSDAVFKRLKQLPGMSFSLPGAYRPRCVPQRVKTQNSSTAVGLDFEPD